MGESDMTKLYAVILHVNENEAARHFVRHTLRSAGFEHVLEARSAAEALSAAAREKPDIAIVDVDLPDMDGLELCRRLKSDAATAAGYVLQTTARSSRAAGLDAGADGVLLHPFEATELIATVRALLRLRAAENALRDRARDLEDASRAKDHFLAQLAHELKSPLGAIQTGVDMLEHVDDKERLLRTRDMLKRQASQVTRLLADLLDVARVDGNRIHLRRERCDLVTIVKEVVAAHRPLFEARNQSFVVECPAAVPVDADGTRVYQIIANLLDNARKYTPERGHVSLTLTTRDEHAVIRVADDGFGMSAAFVPRAFDLFAQADDTLNRASGGLGIGLTLVKRLAELHGGDVSARSDGEGKGSVFEVRLPLAPPA